MNGLYPRWTVDSTIYPEWLGIGVIPPAGEVYGEFGALLTPFAGYSLLSARVDTGEMTTAQAAHLLRAAGSSTIVFTAGAVPRVMIATAESTATAGTTKERVKFPTASDEISSP